jgi:hypothetical protein
VVNGGTPHDLEYAEKLNSDPQRLKIALRLCHPHRQRPY